MQVSFAAPGKMKSGRPHTGHGTSGSSQPAALRPVTGSPICLWLGGAALCDSQAGQDAVLFSAMLVQAQYMSQLALPALQGREKIALIKRFTAMGFNILVSDIDTVWLRDPLPYMAQYPQADVLMSSDSLVSSGQYGASTHLSAPVGSAMQPAGHAAFDVGRDDRLSGPIALVS